MRHHIFKRDVVMAFTEAQKPGYARPDRYLDPIHDRLRFVAVTQRHQQVQREVGDEGERMRRVHRQGRHQWKDVPEEDTARHLLLRVVQIGIGQDHYILRLQFF